MFLFEHLPNDITKREKAEPKVLQWFAKGAKDD